MDAREKIKEINENLDLEYFLDRESLAYRKSRGSSGMQLNIRECPDPECADHRYRVYLNADTGLGNCFVCNETYNKSTFVKMALGIDKWGDFFKAAEDIMRDQGWRPKRLVPVAVDVGEVKLPYSMALPTPEGENLHYLENRGITNDYAAYFGLRYCEYGWWKFKDEEGKSKTQSFNERVIIPVFDLDGTLKTFQGRDILPSKPEVEGEFSRQKYLFPKMLPGTGRYLYNGHNVLRLKEIAMGEGAFDVMALKISFDQDVGLRHVGQVGSFGKHLSFGSETGDDQIGRLRLLKRQGLEKLTIMWDGEPKALESALNAAKRATAIGLRTHIGLMPAGRDPNEVDHETNCQVYRSAPLWTPILDVKLRLKNPYAKR